MYERVLVGTDGSATSFRAVEAAAVMARAHDAELIVAYAFPRRLSAAQELAQRDAPHDVRWRLSPGALAEATVEQATMRVHDAVGTARPVRRVCEPGHPVPVLLRLIEDLDADALVIGNRDMPLRLRTRRSVARALARRATCDVVIVDTIGRREQRRGVELRPALRWT